MSGLSSEHGVSLLGFLGGLKTADEEVGCCSTATIGQLSAGGGHCPLGRVGCPARSQPAWAGLGVTCVQKGKSWIRQALGCGQRSPPFSFLWLLPPTTSPSAGAPPREQTFRPPLALCGAVCLNQCAFWNRILLNPPGVLHVKSQGQVDAHSGRLSSLPKLLQAVKPTTPPTHEGPMGPCSPATRPAGSWDPVGREQGAWDHGPQLGKGYQSPFCLRSDFLALAAAPPPQPCEQHRIIASKGLMLAVESLKSGESLQWGGQCRRGESMWFGSCGIR